MQKDYYEILQLHSSATLSEIRHAYRRLAMQYHPDRNPGDGAEAKFHDIKEAYDVLTNPGKKEMYLQQRWYDQSIGVTRNKGQVSPVEILKRSLELEKYVSTLDVHRMNKEGLLNYTCELLSVDAVEKLKLFNDRAINRQIVTTILATIKPLSLRSVRILLPKLEMLADNDTEAMLRIKNSLSMHKRVSIWNQYKIALMILFTILLCLLIYFTSK